MKKQHVFILAALFAGVLPGALAAEPTLDEALAAYEKARGGVAGWQKVQGMSMSGTYASWSQRHPFTLDKLRPNYYHFSTVSLRGPMIQAVDENGAWWIMPAVGDPPFSRRTPAPSDDLVERDGLFEPPLLNAKAKGHQLKWLGRGDVDGTPTWDIELTLAGTEAKETWHLDAKTFLEVSIEATTWDFTQKGEAMPEITYFEDFRPVGPIVLPYKVQREFQARITSLEVAEIELDPPALKAERFGYQLSEGMAWLRRLHGEHAAKLEFPGRPNQPWFAFTGTSTFTALFDGALLDEDIRVDVFGQPQRTLRRWSYDRADQLFRVHQVDFIQVSPSVYVGKLENDSMVIDNLSTQSGSVDGGTETFERWTVKDLGAEGIRIEADNSSDAGKTWAPAWRVTYTGKEATP